MWCRREESGSAGAGRIVSKCASVISTQGQSSAAPRRTCPSCPAPQRVPAARAAPLRASARVPESLFAGSEIACYCFITIIISSPSTIIISSPSTISIAAAISAISHPPDSPLAYISDGAANKHTPRHTQHNERKAPFQTRTSAHPHLQDNRARFAINRGLAGPKKNG